MKVTKKCRNCSDGRETHRKGNFAFWQCAEYYCTRQNKLTAPNGVCPYWSKKELTYDVSIQRIDQVIEDVKYIKDNVEY